MLVLAGLVGKNEECLCGSLLHQELFARNSEPQLFDRKIYIEVVGKKHMRHDQVSDKVSRQSPQQLVDYRHFLNGSLHSYKGTMLEININ